MTREQFDSVIEDAREIAAKRDLILRVDDDFRETILFDHELLRGKTVIHIVGEQATVDEYLGLKEKRRYGEAGSLTEEVEHEVTWSLGRLLSYCDDSIEWLLEKRGHYSSKTRFSMLSSFPLIQTLRTSIFSSFFLQRSRSMLAAMDWATMNFRVLGSNASSSTDWSP